MKVTVFGARGDQGCAQMRQLLAAGHRPTAVLRDPSLADPAWHCVTADYRLPSTLRAAVDGADAVFLTLPSTSFQRAADVVASAAAVVEASLAAGVSALVFNSSMYIGDAPNGFAAHDARFAIRQYLFGSGLPTVSIQPVIYLDNLLRDWAYPDIVTDRMIRYPHEEELEVCWISEDDTAKLMIAAMEQRTLSGRAFNVGGREPVRGPNLAKCLSKVLGRHIGFETLPIPEFAERMADVFRVSATLEKEALTTALARFITGIITLPKDHSSLICLKFKRSLASNWRAWSSGPHGNDGRGHLHLDPHRGQVDTIRANPSCMTVATNRPSLVNIRPEPSARACPANPLSSA